jgi:hypothetical protein
VVAFGFLFFFHLFLACVLCDRRLAPSLFPFFFHLHVLRGLRNRPHPPSIIGAHAGKKRALFFHFQSATPLGAFWLCVFKLTASFLP